jgi:hypothetical protein
MLEPLASSLSDLPMAFHQAGKKVFGLNQTLPMIMLATTQATTANQLIELKSISASDRDVWLMITNLCSSITEYLFYRLLNKSDSEAKV